MGSHTKKQEADGIPKKTITDAAYTVNLALLTYTFDQAECLTWSSEQVALVSL